MELAERLIGKGFDVRIYDPIVHPARLVGANRRHVESKLPHLGRLLAHEPGEALRGADVAIVSSGDRRDPGGAAGERRRGMLIDLSGRLGRRGRVAARLRGDRLVTRVLIIVQNLPVPFDRRVWLECQALVSTATRSRSSAPRATATPPYEVIDTVELYKYRPYAPGGSKLSFITEYAYSFLATAWLTLQGHDGPAGSR